jgi:hypothetical protein
LAARLWALSLLLAGCAKSARDIEPDFGRALAYFDASCPGLAAERARLAERLIFSGLRQDQVSRDDRIRTFGVPTLFGTIFEGGDEPEIGRLKAELRVIDAEMIQLNCWPG